MSDDTPSVSDEPPCLTAALEWIQRGVGVVPLADSGPGRLIPLIAWSESGPLRTAEEARKYWAAHPDSQIAIVLDNSAVGGPRLGVIDDDSVKHIEAVTDDCPRPRPLGGYRESTRTGGSHDLFRYVTPLPPDIPSRVTGVGGYVDILAGGILYISPTRNAGVGVYTVVTPLGLEIPEYLSMGIALDTASPWLRTEWIAAARAGGRGAGGGLGRDASECWRRGAAARAAGAEATGVQEEVKCDHPEWSDRQIDRTIRRIDRWLRRHPGYRADADAPGATATFTGVRQHVVVERLPCEDTGMLCFDRDGDWVTEEGYRILADSAAERGQVWDEAALDDLARLGGVDPTGLSKGAIHARLRELREGRTTAPGEPLDDEILRGTPLLPVRTQVAARIHEARRVAVKAPAFIIRRDGNLAVDGAPCRGPLDLIPVGLTDRNIAHSEKWKLMQSISGSAYFYSWPLPLHVYTATFKLPVRVTATTDRAVAARMILDTTRELLHRYVAPVERSIGSDGGGGHIVVLPSPEYVSVVLITHASPSQVLGTLAPRSARSFVHDRTIAPVTRLEDTDRWVVEVLDSVMARHTHRGKWWSEIVDGNDGDDGNDDSLRRFHNMRPFGSALIERWGKEDEEEAAEKVPCPFAQQLHPQSPVPQRTEIDYFPYSPNPNTYMEELREFSMTVAARCGRAGATRSTPGGETTGAPGPPVRAE